MKRTTIIALMAGLALCGSASAVSQHRPKVPAVGTFASPNSAVTAAVTDAVAYWGSSVYHSNALGVRPCTRLRVIADVPDGGHMLGDEATATHTTDRPVWRDCTIELSAAFASGTAVLDAWQSACMTVIHEYGHALGLEHSADPSSIMYQYPTAPSVAVPAACHQPNPAGT